MKKKDIFSPNSGMRSELVSGMKNINAQLAIDHAVA